jgi:hypothetical protein
VRLGKKTPKAVSSAFSGGWPRICRGWRPDAQPIAGSVQGRLAAGAAAVIDADGVGHGLGSLLGDACRRQDRGNTVAEAWPSAGIRWVTDINNHSVTDPRNDALHHGGQVAAALDSALLKVLDTASNHGSGFAFTMKLVVKR